MSEQTDLGDNLVRAPAQTVNTNRHPEPDMIISNPQSAPASAASVCRASAGTHRSERCQGSAKLTGENLGLVVFFVCFVFDFCSADKS